MAKKLVYNYTFTPGGANSGTIVVSGNILLRTIQLITNVTDGIIIYNFADSSKGASVSYNSSTEETTITLEHDTSSMSATDEIQIFVDKQEEKIDFSETFVDPVSKLRVSNPQNLIDTDFEYGLQPTKWETIELVNNIPSFFANSSDYSIPDVVSVNSISGNSNITVTTQTEHGLTVGSPIDIQGLGSRTAEGKYLVTSVPSTTSFVYTAKGNQSSTGDISGSYTVITPGEFYSGSNIAIDNENGIETNNADPSTLKITTDYHHGFESGSSLYFTNTIGSKVVELTQTASSNAPDGRPYVDPTDTLNTTLTPTSSLTETKQMKGTYSLKFDSSAVNTANNTITWTGHNLQAGDALLYVPPSGDTHIGGLQRFQIYYVKSAPDANTITLCETTSGNYSGNSTIGLSSAGTSNYGRHQLILCYEIVRNSKSYRSSYVYYYTRYNQSGSGSGRDKTSYSSVGGYGGYFGLSGKHCDRFIFASKSGSISSTYNTVSYSTNYNSNFTFGKSGTTPDGYDFIEDWQRFNNYYWQTGTDRAYFYEGNYGFRSSNTSNSYWSSGTTNYSYGTKFIIPLDNDPEADTLYIQNHGIENGSSVTVTTTSGSNIVYRTDTGTLYYQSPTTSTFSSGSSSNAVVVSPDRIKLSGLTRLQSASGNYSVTATVSNPTKNSFYINGNGLIDGQKLTLSSTGTLPTSNSGAVTPNNNTITTVYNSTKTALDSIKTAMGTDSGLLLFNGNSHNLPINSYRSFFDSGYQYFYYRRYNYIVQLYNSSGQYIGQSTGSMSTGNYATGVAWDPLQSTTLAGQGWYHIATPFEANSTTPYHIDIIQVPDLNSLSLQRARAYLDRNSYNYGANGTVTNHSSISTLSNGWRYTWDANYFAPNGTYHGQIAMKILIENSNWPGYYASSNTYSFGSRNFHMTDFGYYGQRYYINVIIPIKVGSTSSKYGASGSVKTHAQIASDIVTEVTNTLTNPNLTAGTVYVDLIDGNRFALKDVNDVQYDITNNGTAPFTFQTEEITGGVDGYYDVDITDNTTLTSFSNARIPNRTISIANTEVTEINSVVYINKPNHKLNNEQKFVYTESGGTIPGLTSSNTYYAIATGPDHIQIASNGSNATTGSAIGIGTTASGSFTLTVPSVSGRSEAPGTVGITSDTTKITGTDSLFKRFFRTGDILTIGDTSQTPTTFRDFTIASVIDDTELAISEPPGFSLGTAKYYINTKVNVRPDGAFLHRPFDGGVEIDAGTSPNSSIVRQTRKYFRYQSGKGIQCSVAINFNPSRIANTLVSTANTSLPTENYFININNNSTNSYNLSGDHRDGKVNGQNQNITIMKGDVLNLKINAPSHELWIKTAATTGTGDAVTTGVTNNGATSGTLIWDTSSITPGTYYYQCQHHSVMGGEIIVENVGVTTTIATVTTKYPHGLTRNNSVTVRGSDDSVYNGTFDVKSSTDFTYRYYLPSAPPSSNPNGIIEYNIDSWINSAVRCGLFDYQNGMFFEFDGQTLYAVRRSSVQQLPGTARVQKGSNKVFGTDTNFSGQLLVGGYIVIRGQSYRVTNIASATELHIQPAYQGLDSSDAIVTKTVDVKVAQENWNIDKADGTGPSGFILDMTKIQMAYIDYSWYGAGKIRFGFKDTKGHVKYMHEFLHNNRLEEAYMRSGNIPGRYEIENYGGLPSYVPSLFHWGTSVIMDGRFDDDKAYLFTAASNSLSFTNGDSNTATTNAASSLIYNYNWQTREYDFYVRIPFASTDADKFSSGTALYTANNELTGELIDYVDYSGSSVRVHIYVGSNRRYWQPPAVYPSVPQSTVVNIGAPAAGGDDVDLLNEVPLISIRLAPSVDNNLTGSVGQRDIINRMQLQLKQFGITLSHDCNVDLILNGGSSNLSFENVPSPSLSELVKHKSGDRIVGGTKIFSLRASGGTENAAGKRLSNTTDFDLSQITDLGNSVLGGDGTFPNGPDVLTIAIVPIDTSEINADTPLTVSSRITWTESQA